MNRITAGVLGLLVMVAGGAGAQSAAAPATGEWIIRVMDESGTPPAGAEAFAVGSGDTGTTGGVWRHADREAIVRFRKGEVFSPGAEENGNGEAVDVVVRASGFAPAVVSRLRPAGEERGGARDVVLEKGMRAEFVLSTGGRPLPPGLRPVLIDSSHVKAAWRSLTNDGSDPGGGAGPRPVHYLSLGVPEVAGGGRFAFQVPENPPDLYLLVEAPGFLRQFQAGPFRRTQLGAGPIEVKLPEAGSVQAVVHPPTESGNNSGGSGIDAGLPEGGSEISLLRNLDKTSRGSGQAVRVLAIGTTGSTTVRAADLAPGDYKLVVKGGDSTRSLERSLRVSAGKVSRTELGSREVASPAAPRFPELRIVDGRGEPVAGAEVAVRKAGSQQMEGTWHPADNGRVVLKNVSDYAPFGSGEKVEGAYDVLARAPGHGWTTATVEITQPSASVTTPETVTVVLPPGKRVEIALCRGDGKPLPDDLPLSVFTPVWAEQAWHSARLPWSSIGSPKPLFTLAPADHLGGGRFAVTLPDPEEGDPQTSGSAPGEGEFYLLVNGAGVIRGWQGGPYRLGDIVAEGKLEVELPEAASISASFEAPPEGFKEGLTSFTACGLRLLRKDSLKSAGGEVTAWTEVANAEAKDIRVTTTVADLAPGEYRLEVGTGERRDPFHGLWTGDYRRTSETAVAAGESRALALVFKPFDPASLKGDFTAVVKVRRPDGKPVGGKRYTVEAQTRENGLKTVAEGTLSDSGVVEIPDLRTISEPVVMAEVPKEFELPSYSLKIDGENVGSLQTYEWDRSGEVRPIAGGAKRKEFEFQMPPAVGDPAPDIELVELGSGKPLRLSDMKGQVVFLDFWASWCGPCQEPMQHNQEIMTRRGGDWKGKAVILGASIDDEMPTVMNHVKKNGWGAVRQAWCPAGGDDSSGFKAPAPRAYAVNGVPTALLIGADGRIIWRGHPSGFEIEKEIDKLIGAGR